MISSHFLSDIYFLSENPCITRVSDGTDRDRLFIFDEEDENRSQNTLVEPDW